jgi:DNA processing protein
MPGTDLKRLHLRLHLAEGVGAITFRRLVDAFGGAEQVFAAGPREWQGVDGVGPKTADAMSAVTDEQIDEELAEAGKRGVRILLSDDAEYPAALKTIYDWPAVLYVRGELRPSDAIALGVVGSRHCTHYGAEQAERFGQLLGRAGFTIVSGGARGIDTAAHRGALAAGGRTVAVMGCGLTRTYPPENAKLFEQIVSDGRGAIISELPMRTAVLPGNFPTRNRIISGMSLGVLVVEAARHSGALITAKEGAEQGRTVFAVPGRVDSTMSQGTHELIRGGAVLVQGLEDILDQLGEVGSKMAPREAESSPMLPLAGLDQTETSLLDILKEGPLSLDELVRRSGLDSGKVASSMTMLVIKGAVVQQPGSVFAVRSRASRK